jgi:hypothetical protein
VIRSAHLFGLLLRDALLEPLQAARTRRHGHAAYRAMLPTGLCHG